MTLLENYRETYRESSIPVLETERLVLRAPQIEDAKAVVALASDRRVAENTARIPHPYRMSDALEWISSVTAEEGKQTFLITLAGAPIGACGIDLREASPPELGYWIGAPHWGQGYATEAARAVIDHAFTDLGHEALQAGARVSNPASRRVLEKCGFQWTGVGLYRIRAMNSSVPCDRFRLDRGIWTSLKGWANARRIG
jgi:RimJ/RimL family protein N-acetyltransferase